MCNFALFCLEVLEAGDLASLLAQFEASEAVNSDSPGPECTAAEANKETGAGVPTDIQKTPSTEISQHKKALQASPTHQNIKDALPKEIIEKIKGRSTFLLECVGHSECNLFQKEKSCPYLDPSSMMSVMLYLQVQLLS